MTKATMQRLLIELGTRHPVHALPMLVTLIQALVARLPEDAAPKKPRDPFKRFVPMEITIPRKEAP